MCQSRADGLGLKVLVSSEDDFQFDRDVSGILLQYPATDGAVHDYKVSAFTPHSSQSLVLMVQGPTPDAISALEGMRCLQECCEYASELLLRMLARAQLPR